MTKLYIKNMVCNRCKMVVRSTLENQGLHPLHIELGEVEIREALSEKQKLKLEEALQTVGFSLMDDRKSQVIEKIKNLVVKLVHEQNNHLRTNLSDYLSSHIPYEYNYLSNLFAQVEGTTIEQYYIAQKTEKVKELLVYDELSISEIADLLHYSSVAHLSAQFKKVTGLTPTHFRQLKDKNRTPLDDL